MPTGTDDLANLKSSLRGDALQSRAIAHAARAEAAGAALANGFLDAYADGLAEKAVALYWPMRDEIDVRALIGALAGLAVQTALPAMDGRENPLIFRDWAPGDPLVDAAFGVQEPHPDAPVLNPDIVVVPLLGFDRGGNRLGYGGGYYDRTLTRLRSVGKVIAVGVGYDEQEFSQIPVDGGDAPLDVVLTDRRTILVGE